ncbi:uncharacterized protein K452DRAFT_358109 [Aplosporella prunicola CBS 121167]|uniref:Fungal calcium binding protein domain-containing protein n=1 Tax=Aplosporella prunicola CBS 121167 TaxID=1176127 RepID=A0A6A6BJV1_9PEZI|nr:uncharacterized protein K452DRAFT_358109 [Aplosporella prunicola CBS 121167]KAF2143097.1 hypothetical protein K452DRAFT_358109 [Aplosporella prunicola CBS 121167]
MKFTPTAALLSLLTLLPLLTHALSDLDDNDIPQQCRSVCSSIVTLTTQCDAQHDNDSSDNDDNDRAQLDCVCKAENAAADIPSCEACVSRFDDDGSDNGGVFAFVLCFGLPFVLDSPSLPSSSSSSSSWTAPR